MTNEEAIKILSDARDMLIKANEIYGMHDFEKAKEAYDMAIRALGQSDDCEGCLHENKAPTDYPCNICKHNHQNMFEWGTRK